jgi:uncharacterized protein
LDNIRRKQVLGRGFAAREAGELPALGIGLVIFAVVLAGVLRGITGFGGAMLMTPLLSIVLGGIPAIIVVLIMEAAAALVMVPAVYQDLPRGRLALLVIPACLTVPLGSVVLTVLDPSASRRFIGAAVVISSLALMSGIRYARKPTPALTAAISALSGFLLGATSIGAPPVILFLLSGPDPAKTTRAILTGFISITSVIGLVATLRVGSDVAPPVWLDCLLCVLYLGSIYLGMKLFRRLNDFGARIIALSLMLTFGAITVVLG